MIDKLKKAFSKDHYQEVELQPGLKNDLEAAKEAKREAAKEDQANFLSRLFFMWAQSTVSLGASRKIRKEDLGPFPKHIHTEAVDVAFQELFAEEVERFAAKKKQEQRDKPVQDTEQSEERTEFLSGASKKEPFLVQAKKLLQSPLSQAFWKYGKSTLIFGFLLKIVATCCSVSSPLVLRSLLQFLQAEAAGEHRDFSTGVILAVMLFVLSGSNAYCLQHLYWIGFKTGCKFRGAIMTSVYRKLLRLSPTEKRAASSGQMMNLVSVDSQRLMNFIWNPHDWWSGPLAIVINLSLLFWLVSYSALPGVITLFIMGGPFNLWLTRLAVKYEEGLISVADDRINHINEILLGMRFLKLYNWEDCFKDRATKVRENELLLLKKIAYTRAFINFLWTVIPATVSLMTFIVYSLTGGTLSPALAFTILALVNNIREPMVKLFGCIFELTQAYIAVGRVNEFLSYDEVELPTLENDPEYAVRLDGSFAWDTEGTPTLDNLQLKVPHGKLYVVVGPVGSGKTSLISAVLGEIKKVKGEAAVSGKTISTSQVAWLLNASVRDNILFGEPYDQKRYETVIKRAALQRDIDGFPAGDQTEIGERGVNLSGGQKQRVCLARALYRQDADIFLFDEPLGAVDSTVANWIFHECMLNHLQNKTRILVTHQLQFLPFADCIIVMQNGVIKHQGSFEELMKKGVELSSIVQSHKEKLQKIRSSSKLRSDEIAENGSGSPKSNHLKEELRRAVKKVPSKETTDSNNTDEISSSVNAKPKKIEKPDGKLTQEEEMDSESIGMRLYLKYFSFGSTAIFGISIALYVFSQAARVGTDYWLVWWTSAYIQPDPGLGFYIGIYATCFVVASILVFLREICLAYACIRSARNLHSQMLDCMLRSPMNFFDATPIGRILNRFSKDQSAIDESLAPILSDVGSCGIVTLSVVILICMLTPALVAPMILISILYYLVQRYYKKTARELKQIDSVSKSPIYSYFSETVSGSTTIRSYRMQDKFRGEFIQRIDENVSAYYWHFAVNRWLGVRLELVSALVVLSTGLVTVGSAHFGALTTGLAGLSLSYALSITANLNWFVRQYTEMQIQMTAVSRVIAYTEIKPEAPMIIADKRPPSGWPPRGEIAFNKLFVRYTEGADHVLKGINCSIKSSEKIGIVGRTGAGKSSLTASLFRLLEASSGSIVIDDHEIGQLGLSDLRSNISIIPQDPLLFSGTIRFNLDPHGRYSDAQLWEALQLVNLKSVVESLPLGLDALISENGENFSLGQRQLFSLCRVILKKTRILVLDEATASLDLETDELIQATVRSQFADSTVLTIAHRLDTIIDSNRIMVLDKGELKEFDTPDNLLADPKSLFSGLIESTLAATMPVSQTQIDRVS